LEAAASGLRSEEHNIATAILGAYEFGVVPASETAVHTHLGVTT
jgi:hypothetical protein